MVPYWWPSSRLRRNECQCLMSILKAYVSNIISHENPEPTHDSMSDLVAVCRTKQARLFLAEFRKIIIISGSQSDMIIHVMYITKNVHPLQPILLCCCVDDIVSQTTDNFLLVTQRPLCFLSQWCRSWCDWIQLFLCLSSSSFTWFEPSLMDRFWTNLIVYQQTVCAFFLL